MWLNSAFYFMSRGYITEGPSATFSYSVFLWQSFTLAWRQLLWPAFWFKVRHGYLDSQWVLSLQLANTNHCTVVINPTTFNSMDPNPCKVSPLFCGGVCVCLHVYICYGLPVKQLNSLDTAFRMTALPEAWVTKLSCNLLSLIVFFP